MNLKKQDIRLGQEISNKEEAIRKAGEILVENGYVDADYIPAMLEREEIVSTYMGNFIAIPHGTDEAKKSIKITGISIIQIKWYLLYLVLLEKMESTWNFYQKLQFSVLNKKMLLN